jgi:hypothetical protein
MNPSAILQQLTQFSTPKNDAPSPSINPFSPLEQPKEATKKMEENKGLFLINHSQDARKL